MNKKLISISLIVVIIGAGFFLFGCKNQQIQFYRESAASTLIDKFKTNQPTSSKSSGMLIIKDESSSSSQGVKFGPGDINFDMPVRIK